MATSSSKSIVPVFLLFLVLLLGWFVYSAIGIVNAIGTQHWLSTTGTVTSSEVKKVASKGTHQYQPHVSYTYEVNGEDFSSSKFSSTQARGSMYWAKEVIDNYQAEKSITVYYNPKKPGQSVLMTGLQYDNYWMGGLSGFFFVVVLLAFIKQLKKR